MTPPHDDIESFNKEAEQIRLMQERRRKLIATEREQIATTERLDAADDKVEQKREVRRRAQREARDVGAREAETVGRSVKNLDLETAAIERNRAARERQAEVQKRQAIDFGRATRGGRDPLFSATYGRQEAGETTSQHALRQQFGIGGTRATTLQQALAAGLRPAQGPQGTQPLGRVTASEVALERSKAELTQANSSLANARRRASATDEERLELIQARDAARLRVQAAEEEFRAAQASVVATQQRIARERAETGVVVRDPAATQQRRQEALQREELGFIRRNSSRDLELRDRESYERRRVFEAQQRRVEAAQRDLAGRPIASGLHPDSGARPSTTLVPTRGGGAPGTDLVLHNAQRYEAQRVQDLAALGREERARLRTQRTNDIAGRPIASGEHPDAAMAGPPPMANRAAREYTQTTVRMEAAERAAAAASREQAVAFTTASNSMMRHGALSSEFIQAAARGEASIRDLGSQAVVTAGKFGGWLAAGSAIYMLGDAVKQIGTGALQASSGVDQLKRVATVNDRGKASQGFANLAREFNVPIETAADAVYQMGQRFHNQDDAQKAARSSLAAVVAGEMDLTQATGGLLAITRAYNLSANDTMRVIDQANKAQNDYGATIPDIVTGLARAGGAWSNAGGDLDYLQALMVDIQTTTKETGNTIGTGMVRGVNAFRSESGKAQLAAQGVKVDVNSMQNTLQSAFEAVGNGADPNAVAKGLLGPHYFRLLAPVLRDQQHFNEIMQDTTGAKAQGSAMTEVNQVMRESSQQLKEVGISLQALGEALGSAGAFAPLGLALQSLNGILHLAVNLVNVFNEIPAPIAHAVTLLGEGYAIMRLMQRFGATERLAGGPLGFMASPDRALQRQARSGLRGRAEVEQQTFEAAQQRAYSAGTTYETRARMAAEYSRSANYRRGVAIDPDTASEEDLRKRTRALNTMEGLENESKVAGHRLTQANLEAAAARESAVRAEQQFVTVSNLHHSKIRQYLETQRIALPREMGRPSTMGTQILPGSVTSAEAQAAARSYGARSAKVVQMMDNAIITAMGRPQGIGRNLPTRLPVSDDEAYRAWQNRADEANRQRMGMTGEERRQHDRRTMGTSYAGRPGGSSALPNIIGVDVDREANRTTVQARNAEGDLSRSTRALQRTSVATGSVTGGLGKFGTGMGRFAGGLKGLVAGLGPLDAGLLAVMGTSWAVDAMKKREKQADDFEKESFRVGASAQAHARNIQDSQRRLTEKPKLLGVLPVNLDSAGAQVFYQAARRERDVARANVKNERERQEMIADATKAGTDRPQMFAEDLNADIERDTQAMKAGLLSKQEFEARIARYAREAKMLYMPSRNQMLGVQQTLADATRGTGSTDYRTALANMDGKQVAAEQSATLVRVQNFGPTRATMQDARMQYEDAIRRWRGGNDANTQTNIEGMAKAREAYYQIIAQSVTGEMQRDLTLAHSGPQRQAVFTQARSRLASQVNTARDNARKSRDEANQRRKELDDATKARQAAEGAAPGTGGTDPLTGMKRLMGEDGPDLAALKKRESEAKGAVATALKERDRNEDELKALLRTEADIHQAITDAEFQDRRTRRASVLAVSQARERDPQKDAKLAIDKATRDQRDALRTYGRDSDEYRSATVDLFTARNQLAQSVKANVDAENAMIMAQAGTDPVSQARAATQGARNTLRAMQSHSQAYSPDDIKTQRAAVITAQKQQQQTETDQATRLAEVQGRIEVARAGNDPVAAARAAQRAAKRAMRTANDPVARAEALLASIEANNDLETALAERESARGRYLASKTGDPVATARADRQEAERAARKAPKGTTEWYEAQAKLNDARRAEVDSQLASTSDDIDFEREMGQLSVGDAIAKYQTLLESRNWTKQQRREIQRKIKSLQDESANDASGFNLGTDNLKLPTAYDVRRAFDPVRATVRRQVEEARRTVTGQVDDPVHPGKVNVRGRRASVYNDVSESVSNMYDQRAQVQAQVNVVVNDRNAVAEVYEALDRVLGTTVRAKARAAGRR